MSDTNWDLVKFKYEVLGITLEQLAAEYSESLAVLKFNSQTWKQIPLAKQEQINLEDISSLEDVLERLGDETATQTKAFSVLKQKFLGPKYVELETVLLHKAIEMAGLLKANDPAASKTLRSLATVLADLLQHNPMLAPDAEGGGGGNGNKWEISFVDVKKEDDETST